MPNQQLIQDKIQLLETLTGVHSSKLNYYLEVKRRNEEIIKQNHQLEIIHQIIKDINIDMSLTDIMQRVYQRLPLVIRCQVLGLALLQEGQLTLSAMVPDYKCTHDSVPFSTFILRAIEEKECLLMDLKQEVLSSSCPPIRGLDLSSLVIDPLMVKGTVIGVLFASTNEESAYQTGDVQFIQQLTDQLAIYIENARMYEEVLRSKTEWEETFKALTDPIYLIDSNHNIIRSNIQPEAIPGSPSEIPEKCFSFIWGRTEKCEDCLMDSVLKNKMPVYKRIHLSDDKIFDANYYPVVKDDGTTLSVILHLKDVTEQIKLETQVLRSDKLAAIGEMAAGVAHELNSPLTVIIGNSQILLRDPSLDESTKDLLQDIANSGLRCKRIVQNLLTFSRQDQRPFTRTHLNDAVERVLNLVRYQIDRSNIRIVPMLDPNLPEIMANEQQIEQVLINLLLNASDAVEKNFGDKEIVLKTNVESLEGNDYAVASVIDNGEGISPEDLAKIFNPFFTSKEVNRGTGLGLSVSLGIAQAHGGTIKVTSAKGQGSIFSLFIPINSSHE